LLAISKLRFYSEPMREMAEQTNSWSEPDFPLDRARRWHPLHRGVWIAARVLLVVNSEAGSRESPCFGEREKSMKLVQGIYWHCGTGY
jgi:hypothetical protein